MALAKVDKPLKRMWMQSMTDGAILEVFDRLREDGRMKPLADAALCRSESDWLVGLNGSRALTAFNSRQRRIQHDQPAACKRQRWRSSANANVPSAILCRAITGRCMWSLRFMRVVYEGRWFREEFSKPEGDDQARAERIWSEAEASVVVERCTSQTGIVEETKKPSNRHRRSCG